MTLVNSLNEALDRMDRRSTGHRALRLLAMTVSSVGGAVAVFAAGSTQASAQCSVCCTSYQGYNCVSDCGRIQSTTWACTNNCGKNCTCPDCWLPDGTFVGHCDNGCGSCPCAPSP